MFKKSLRDEIKVDEFALKLMYDYLIDPVIAVAFCIDQAIQGKASDDVLLINVTVLFSDLFKGYTISNAFIKFGGDLAGVINGDLLGEYSDIVLALWGQMYE